jgi:hypothetical protein
MKKRKSPVAKNLVKNSVAAIFSAIEIHNKPIIQYRYEIVVLLILNAWELLLKAYLYKFHRDIKLFNKDGTTKQFENCLNIVGQKKGRIFLPEQENLSILYEYRNQVAHFYIEELDPILFSLISKNIIFYAGFLKANFDQDLSKQSNLILLPIGFNPPISPFDYISKTSGNNKSSFEVREFIERIINSTRRLSDEKIDETIFVNFKMNLTNVNRISNADIIAGIDNTKLNPVTLSTKKEIILSRKNEYTKEAFYYEELAEGIFDEINNIINANQLLAKTPRFILGDKIYYRIYSERQHVDFTIETFDLLARTAMIEHYAPFLHWLIRLPAKNVIDILITIFEDGKSRRIYNVIKFIFLLGAEAVEIFSKLLTDKYKTFSQKPEFFYSFKSIKESKQKNPIFKCLKATPNKSLIGSITYDDFLKDNSITHKMLSQECLSFFNGEKPQKNIIMDLDFLAHASVFLENKLLIEELKSRYQ